VLSTGGACIAPSGVQKERMQAHEIFVVSLDSSSSAAQTCACTANTHILLDFCFAFTLHFSGRFLQCIDLF
jgi:hypothetical protein